MNRYKREPKLIIIGLLLLVIVTSVPNAVLKNWFFLIFMVGDFYLVYLYLKKRGPKRQFVVNCALIGMFVLAVASVFLNMAGF